MTMYPDNFQFYANGMDEAVGVAAIFIVIWLAACLLSVAYSIVMYVLHGVGMYTIAQRRGIHRPWLSWVPVANMWILGSISDQYQYVTKGKVRSRRKLLLGLTIATYVLLIVFWICYIAFMVQAVGSAFEDTFMNAQVLRSMLSMLGVCGVMSVVAILTTVFQYIAYYDLFHSSNPGNSSTFLVLSILLSFLLPIFVFCCRKKDLGMPPKKSAAVQTEPVPEVIPAEVIDTENVETDVVEALEEDFEE